MALFYLIDGNNLLHAIWEHGPAARPGREAMLRMIERWAGAADALVTLVLDGARPTGQVMRPRAPGRVAVQFSAPRTADDLLIALIEQAPDPGRVCVVSSDGAIAGEARRRRCRAIKAEAFVSELFPAPAPPTVTPATETIRPAEASPEERKRWLEVFGEDGEDPFDGADAMRF